ncbi:MAG: polyprenyl synthetase family protein [Bacteroidota bacterium]
MHQTSYLSGLLLSYMKEHPFTQPPQQLYEPIDYILGLGGKRIRPLLVLMACNLYQEEVEAALPAAHAVEIFHNFSLLHDDIMDNAPIRRGQPAVHVRYDVNTGILSGDVMLIYSYEYLLKSPTANAEQKVQLVSFFNQSAIEVCEGQQLDMNFENREDVEIAEYLKMIELKTAALLSGALRMGGLVGGAGEADLQSLDLFGRKMGIAFQLQDDLLDTYGDPAKFGKKVGGDIAQNKKTYLMLKAMERAGGPILDRLKGLMSDDTIDEAQKISAVTEIYNSLDVRKATEELQQRYMLEAFAALDAVSVGDERKKILKELANRLLGRES